MNKETIQFAVEKMKELVETMAPAAQQLGQEYIDFVVFKVILLAIIAVSITVIATITVCWSGYRMATYRMATVDDFSDNRYIFYAVILMVSAVIGIFSSLNALFYCIDAALAYKFPLMYTLEQLAK